MNLIPAKDLSIQSKEYNLGQPMNQNSMLSKAFSKILGPYKDSTMKGLTKENSMSDNNGFSLNNIHSILKIK